MKRILICMLAFLLVCQSGGRLYASSTGTGTKKTLNDLKKEQNEIVSDQKDMSDKLNETQNQQKTLFEEIQQLDDEIAASEDALAEISELLSETIDSLSRTAEDLLAATETKDQQMDTYKERVQVIYENGDISYWQVLLSSESFSDFFNRLEYISDIIGYDQRLLDNLAATEELIAQQLAQIAQQKEDIEFLNQTEQQKKDDLEENRIKKDEFMQVLAEDEALYLQQINELQQASNEIELLIKKKQEEEEAARKAAAAAAAKKAAEEAAAKKAAAAAAEAKKAEAAKNTQSSYTGGTMAWPVPGYTTISSEYKNRKDPITGVPEFHSGIDIPAPKGTKVLAAESGVVITSGTLSGYGKTIIIDHGGGVYTLYGHNSKLIATVGQKVKRGDTVAEVGSTGHSTGNHCHFEVRINGKHTSPWAYLK